MSPSPRKNRNLELRLPAIEITQGQRRKLYTFAVDGKLLHRFATISRIHRDNGNSIQGYQRPEVLSHINAIRRYIESENPLIPNALVVAFDRRVRFEVAPEKTKEVAYARSGVLVVPLDESIRDEDKPGWVVDGQQRSAAIRDARVRRFPICVTAFITDDESDQRSQFILVNSTKPLPKGLIHKLLPSTSGALPIQLMVRRFPALLLERLNYDEDSPLYKMISTPTTTEGIIKSNSVLKTLENSLSDGALYLLRDSATGEGDIEAMLAILKSFWTAVKQVFPDAWGLAPRRSRLMHGVGIVSMGFVMDAIIERYIDSAYPTVGEFVDDLLGIADLCKWTSGVWNFGRNSTRRWNDLQNTPKDIQLLTNYLLFEYRARVWRQPLRGRKHA